MNSITKLAVNYAKSISAETISKAKSGHTGIAVGAAPILFSLFKDHYFYDINDTKFINRDRLVVSAGHASALLYTLQFMFNMNMTEFDLQNFRRLNSKTPGHPEYSLKNCIEMTTGPLGQGVATAVGMAIAESMLEKKFSVQRFPIVNHYTYCFAGDGDLMEGVAQEALSLAGTLKLNRFIVLYDSNNITMDGKATIANAENAKKKYKAMGFNVITVKNARDVFWISRAIGKAKKSSKPTLIVFKTIIGEGTELENSADIHGKALTGAELENFKIKLGTQGSFYLPEDVKQLCKRTNRINNLKKDKWLKNYVLFEKTHPDLFKQFMGFFEDKKISFDKYASQFANECLSGRDGNHKLLNEIVKKMSRLVGGTADLKSSCRAYLDDMGDYSKINREGRNIHYGIREHAMGAISNGLALYLDSPVFDATFLSFSNYMIPPIRLSAMMGISTWHFFTHDSFLIGEDGPTHQPIEQLTMLRSIPNLKVFRPCDQKELVACYQMAFENASGPSAFILSKTTLPPMDGKYENMTKGGYVLLGESNSDVTIMATGSEIEMAARIREKLLENGISVCVSSMPCLDLFDKNSKSYKNAVIGEKSKLRVSLEASNDNIWLKYLGQNGLQLVIDHYGKSGNATDLQKEFDWTVSDFVKKIKKSL